MLSTSDLNKCMNDHPCYSGTFSWDLKEYGTVKKKLDSYNHTCFIVNTQSEVYAGEHWIAVMLWKDRAEVFDPLGQPTGSRLLNFLGQFTNKIWTNSILVEPVISLNVVVLCSISEKTTQRP